MAIGEPFASKNLSEDMNDVSPYKALALPMLPGGPEMKAVACADKARSIVTSVPTLRAREPSNFRHRYRAIVAAREKAEAIVARVSSASKPSSG